MSKTKITHDLTVGEFCVLEGISLPAYMLMRPHDLTPDEITVPGTNFKRITPQAREKWRREMEQPGRLSGFERSTIKALRQMAQRIREKTKLPEAAE